VDRTRNGGAASISGIEHRIIAKRNIADDRVEEVEQKGQERQGQDDKTPLAPVPLKRQKENSTTRRRRMSRSASATSAWLRRTGSVSLAEIGALRGKLGLPVERDLHFKAAKSLTAYADEARLLGRIKA
jgi:Protein of unknown function (DUF2958)